MILKGIVGRVALIVAVFAFFSACNEDANPRPRGYFRIDLPEKSWQEFETGCPFTFEFPIYASLSADRAKLGERCWYDIHFTKQRATLHLSYKRIQGNLPDFLEDSRRLVYKHTVKANDIEEYIVQFPERKVYGTVYEIGGNTATSLQFHLTDSTKHFLRASLYFNASPNIDSLGPVLSFIRTDVDHLLKTFTWQD